MHVHSHAYMHRHMHIHLLARRWIANTGRTRDTQARDGLPVRIHPASEGCVCVSRPNLDQAASAAEILSAVAEVLSPTLATAGGAELGAVLQQPPLETAFPPTVESEGLLIVS